MSDTKKSPFAKLTKAIIILVLKLIGVIAAFIFRIIAAFLTKLSEFLEKATGNGSTH